MEEESIETGRNRIQDDLSSIKCDNTLRIVHL
mgnify:FL=1